MRVLILILACIVAYPSTAWAMRGDGDPDALLASMSLEQKLGQLFMVFFQGPALSPELSEMITDYHVGGLILYSITGNTQHPAQVARLTANAQRKARESDSPGLIIAVDQEGGPVTRLTNGFTVFPPNMAAAAAGMRAVKTKARITASELKAVGVNMNLAPVADVNVNPDNPIIGVRAYGSSPDRVSRMVAEAVESYNNKGVASCAKHFPGHGDTGFDSHLHLPVVPHDLDRLEAVELAPFRAAIRAGVPAIMTAHVAVPALTGDATLPATMSPRVLGDVLRNGMGFDGVIITDSLGMGALDKRFGIEEAAEQAFLAGADILLFGADKGHTPAEQKTAYAHLLAKFKSGKLPTSRLDESVRRILKLKLKFGMLTPEPADPDIAPRLTNTAAHRHAAENLARDSITVIRDDQGLLPLSSASQTLVLRFGGKSTLPGPLGNARSMSISLNPAPQEAADARQAAASAEQLVILVNQARHNPGQAQLVRELAGPNTVVALIGAPYDEALFPDAYCMVASYSGIQASMSALSDALFGVFSPRGKLPVDLSASRTGFRASPLSLQNESTQKFDKPINVARTLW